MSGLSSFVFFVYFLCGSTNQRPPKFPGLSTFAKKYFWPVLTFRTLIIFVLLSKSYRDAFFLTRNETFATFFWIKICKKVFACVRAGHGGLLL